MSGPCWSCSYHVHVHDQCGYDTEDLLCERYPPVFVEAMICKKKQKKGTNCEKDGVECGSCSVTWRHPVVHELMGCGEHKKMNKEEIKRDNAIHKKMEEMEARLKKEQE